MPGTSKDLIPRSRYRLRPSLPTVIVVLAILILAGVWGVSTFHDVRRQEKLVKELRNDSAQTLIHTLEAATRSALFGGSPPPGGLGTLVEEAAAQEDVAFIVLLDARGRLVAAAGSWMGGNLELPVWKVLAAKGKPLYALSYDAKKVPVFMVGKTFAPIEVPGPLSESMLLRYLEWCGLRAPFDPATFQQAIFVGFYTEAVDKARRADMVRNIGQGVLLLLLGSVALYLLFVHHGSRVAQHTLNAMELYTRNVIDSMPAGLLTLDAAGLVVSHNARAIELLGIGTPQPVGQNLQQLMGQGGGELMAALGDRDEILEAPVDCHRLDGQIVPLKISASRLLDREGNLLGTVLILRDLREIRAMEEQLERSRRHAALGQMATGIAHEIRNPLGTLKGFAQYFARFGKGDAAATEYAALMVGEVDRLNRTISALLQYARPREPEFQPVDLAALLERTARFVEDEMVTHGLHFRLDLPETPLTLAADPDLLTQVLLNLLQNAIAACSEGNEIVLRASADGAQVRLQVRDNGHGIPEELQARIFDPFFTTRKTGTGLGLAVVHQIIDGHGGRIAVDSAPGQGTSITLIFPERPNHAEPKR